MNSAVRKYSVLSLPLAGTANRRESLAVTSLSSVRSTGTSVFQACTGAAASGRPPTSCAPPPEGVDTLSGAGGVLSDDGWPPSCCAPRTGNTGWPWMIFTDE